MEQSFAKLIKICSTCEYWEGARKLEYNDTRIKVDNMAKAKCVLKGGPWYNVMKDTMQSCAKWKLWFRIK